MSECLFACQLSACKERERVWKYNCSCDVSTVVVVVMMADGVSCGIRGGGDDSCGNGKSRY